MADSPCQANYIDDAGCYVTPACAGQPYIPPAVQTQLDIGWDAGAHSVATESGDLDASFSMPANVAGVVIGLKADRHDSTNVGAIQHGLYFSGNTVQVMESGVSRTAPAAYAATDVFHIRRVTVQVLTIVRRVPRAVAMVRHTEVQYWQNDVLLRAIEVTDTTPRLLGACLYMSGDAAPANDGALDKRFMYVLTGGQPFVPAQDYSRICPPPSGGASPPSGGQGTTCTTIIEYGPCGEGGRYGVCGYQIVCTDSNGGSVGGSSYGPPPSPPPPPAPPPPDTPPTDPPPPDGGYDPSKDLLLDRATRLSIGFGPGNQRSTAALTAYFDPTSQQPIDSGGRRVFDTSRRYYFVIYEPPQGKHARQLGVTWRGRLAAPQYATGWLTLALYDWDALYTNNPENKPIFDQVMAEGYMPDQLFAAPAPYASKSVGSTSYDSLCSGAACTPTFALTRLPCFVARDATGADTCATGVGTTTDNRTVTESLLAAGGAGALFPGRVLICMVAAGSGGQDALTFATTMDFQ